MTTTRTDTRAARTAPAPDEAAPAVPAPVAVAVAVSLDDDLERLEAAVLAGAGRSAAAVAEAGEAAARAVAAGDLAGAVAALEEAREHAAQARRAIRAASSAAGSRRAVPGGVRPGELRDLVEGHLREFPGKDFTPYQVGKVLGRSSGAVGNAMDKLVSLGVAELAGESPRAYRLAPGAEATAA
jgi:hypothetical protein